MPHEEYRPTRMLPKEGEKEGEEKRDGRTERRREGGKEGERGKEKGGSEREGVNDHPGKKEKDLRSTQTFHTHADARALSLPFQHLSFPSRFTSPRRDVNWNCELVDGNGNRRFSDPVVLRARGRANGRTEMRMDKVMEEWTGERRDLRTGERKDRRTGE